MDQFGVHMYFLWIKQILAFIYALKINFYLLLMDFLTSWTRRQLQESAGVLAQKILRHRLAREGLRVWISKSAGVILKECQAGWVWVGFSRPIGHERLRLERASHEPVSISTHGIRDLRSPSTHDTGQSPTVHHKIKGHDIMNRNQILIRTSSRINGSD
jgi:hypothetical protein